MNGELASFSIFTDLAIPSTVSVSLYQRSTRTAAMDTAAVISTSSCSRTATMAATVSGILSPEPVMPHTTFSVIVITSSG